MIIRAKVNGQEREFEVLSDGQCGSTHIITKFGDIMDLKDVVSGSLTRVCLRLISPRHTFGGVTYKEIDHRNVYQNEWYGLNLNTEYARAIWWPYPHNASGPYTILRPVSFEE